MHASGILQDVSTLSKASRCNRIWRGRTRTRRMNTSGTSYPAPPTTPPRLGASMASTRPPLLSGTAFVSGLHRAHRCFRHRHGLLQSRTQDCVPQTPVQVWSRIATAGYLTMRKMAARPPVGPARPEAQTGDVTRDPRGLC